MSYESKVFVAGEWVEGPTAETVENKFTGGDLADVFQASLEQVDRAVGHLLAAYERSILSPYRRFEVLTAASRLLDERRERFRDVIIAESGFTHADANGEVERAIQTLRLSAEEATRLSGEMIPLDGAPGVSNRIGYTIRRPIGVVCAITPFNSPLNTVAHKVAPAIAAGNVVVLKPATYTPFTSALLVHLLLDAGLPEDHIALLHGGGSTVGNALLEDQRLGFYTFTGSTPVGRHIQRTVGLRRTQLELGSLSSTIVCADADLRVAAQRSASAAFRKAGQVCTSVQRLLIDRSVVEEFTAALVEETKLLRAGDPQDPDVSVGPLISGPEAERVEAWVNEAVEGGADVLAGGVREHRVVSATILSGVSNEKRVVCEEVFGPVVSLTPFTSLDEAIIEANGTPFGLAAGIFTNDVSTAMLAAERLRMGSVHINQTSSSRIDLMPYGGVKESGFGHEGPRYSVREMTEERLITISY